MCVGKSWLRIGISSYCFCSVTSELDNGRSYLSVPRGRVMQFPSRCSCWAGVRLFLGTAISDGPVPVCDDRRVRSNSAANIIIIIDSGKES